MKVESETLACDWLDVIGRREKVRFNTGYNNSQTVRRGLVSCLCVWSIVLSRRTISRGSIMTSTSWKTVIRRLAEQFDTALTADDSLATRGVDTLSTHGSRYVTSG